MSIPDCSDCPWKGADNKCHHAGNKEYYTKVVPGSWCSLHPNAAQWEVASWGVGAIPQGWEPIHGHLRSGADSVFCKHLIHA